MFAPSYFAPTYWPGRYFPSGAPAVVPDVPLKYFPGDYFPRSYFPGDYFPVGSTSISSGYPADLPEAVGRLFDATPSLRAAFAAIWSDAKPRGEPLPALILKVPTATRIASDDRIHWHRLAPSLTVVAASKAEAAALAETVLGAVKNQTFVYGTGGEVKTGRWILRDRRRAKDQAETVNGEKVFRDALEFEAIEFRPRY